MNLPSSVVHSSRSSTQLSTIAGGLLGGGFGGSLGGEEHSQFALVEQMPDKQPDG